MKSVTLDSLAKQIRRCTKCPLHASRTKAVPGDGPATAALMIIGEAPGQSEDECGRPFVGLAGRWLTDRLKEAGLDRRDVFITNTVKCRPPGNRTPKRMEVETCTSLYLREQIRLVNPRWILLLGSVAAKALLGLPTVRAARGRVIVHDGRRYIVAFHPVAPVARRHVRRDFALLKSELERQ